MLKQNITDEFGEILSVVIKYEYFKEFESVFEDYLFGEIILKSENEDELSLEDTKVLLGFKLWKFLSKKVQSKTYRIYQQI